MTKLGKLEKALLALSSIIVLMSFSAITIGFEQVLHWFNLDEKYSKNKLAEARAVHDSARRKEYLTPEFRPLKEKQSVFNNDSIMTGHESGLTLYFLDGSKVELAPDTMVEVKAQGDATEPEKYHFEITVDQGQVKGSSPEKSVKVKQVKSSQVEVLKPETKALEEARVSQSSSPIPSASNSHSIEIEMNQADVKINEADKEVGKPVSILAAGPKIVEPVSPQLKLPLHDSMKHFKPSLEVLFTWSYAAGQSEFLFEISSNDTFTELVYSSKTNLNFMQFFPSKKGIYYWRVTDLKTTGISKTNRLNLQ